jgi:hypothetical protein
MIRLRFLIGKSDIVGDILPHESRVDYSKSEEAVTRGGRREMPRYLATSPNRPDVPYFAFFSFHCAIMVILIYMTTLIFIYSLQFCQLFSLKDDEVRSQKAFDGIPKLGNMNDGTSISHEEASSRPF